MAEAPVAIPADVLKAARPVVHAAAEAPAAAVAEAPVAGAAGENPIPPAEEVSWFRLFSYRCWLLCCIVLLFFVAKSKACFPWCSLFGIWYYCLAYVAFLVCFQVVISFNLAFYTLVVFESVFQGVCRLRISFLGVCHL